MHLANNVIVEPLIHRWHAWAHLVAPTTAAMSLANAQLKMMDSFVMAPEVHLAALRNPAMRGGPFIDLDPSLVGEVRALLATTRERCGAQLELADAIKRMSATLANTAKGQSLEPLYESVPSALKGLVELAYDVNHQPALRFIEPLVYKSR